MAHPCRNRAPSWSDRKSDYHTALRSRRLGLCYCFDGEIIRGTVRGGAAIIKREFAIAAGRRYFGKYLAELQQRTSRVNSIPADANPLSFLDRNESELFENCEFNRRY